jgi:hypothetical protein
MLKDAGASVKGFDTKRKSLGVFSSLDRKFLTEWQRNGADSSTVEGSGTDEPVAETKPLKVSRGGILGLRHTVGKLRMITVIYVGEQHRS